MTDVVPKIAAIAPAGELEHVHRFAPDAYRCILDAWQLTDEALAPDLLRSVRATIEEHLIVSDPVVGEPLPQGLHELVEQFVVHVASTGQRQRERGAADLQRLGGPDLPIFMNALYVLDMTARLRLSLGLLLGSGPGGRDEPPSEAPRPADLAEAISELHHAAMRLSLLEIETTELVRIRCGRYHDCRVCLSLRLADGSGHRAVDESVLDKLDDYPLSDLTERQKTALRVADAYLTDPAAIDEDLRAATTQFFSPEEVVEMLLDIISWTQQKPLVALAIDVPIRDDRLMALVLGADGQVRIKELV